MVQIIEKCANNEKAQVLSIISNFIDTDNIVKVLPLACQETNIDCGESLLELINAFLVDESEIQIKFLAKLDICKVLVKCSKQPET